MTTFGSAFTSRAFHTTVLNPYSGTAYTIAGKGAGVYNDTWALGVIRKLEYFHHFTHIFSI